MTISKLQAVDRKSVKEIRIAICPQFGCSYLKKVKPLKFGILGLHKYPKCSTHGQYLVIVEEFIDNFVNAVNSCLYDKGGLPPEKLINVIKLVSPEDLKRFINGWMYCNPIGRGAQLVSKYLNGLSKASIRLLSRKQKNLIQNSNSKKPYNMLRKALIKISDEYSNFLKTFSTYSNNFYEIKAIKPLTGISIKFLEAWLRDQLKEIKNSNITLTREPHKLNDSLHAIKGYYNMILQSRTCSTLLGKSPRNISRTIPAFELFSAFHDFLHSGLCSEINYNDIQELLQKQEESSNLFNTEPKSNILSEIFTSKMSKYTTENLINDLTEELNKYPKEMFNLNPNRINREHTGCTLQDISKLWGHHNGYVSEKLNYQKNNPNYILPKKNLNELKQNLKKKFGHKANSSIILIDTHNSGQLSFNMLINNLRIELGKISQSVKTTLEDLALIFGYGYGMMGYIRQHDNFVLSRERISLIENNLIQVLGSNANGALKICKKYVDKNPNLPKYPNQKYTITKPNLFQDFYNENTMYWFGWLCSDGWVSQPDNKHHQIQLKLKREDRKIVERFADAVGYDHDRILDETYLLKEDGNIRQIHSSRVFFGCKPMWHDLEKIGIFDFKNSEEVPRIIRHLVTEAKSVNPNGKLISSIEGRLALNFLIGFYDGDGNYRGGMSARILNSKKKFLEEIADLFDIPNSVKVNAKNYIDKNTYKIVWKTRYQLHLGVNIFEQMLLSYNESLQRKRPNSFKQE
ncbi:MAG: hypothetical protein ACFFBE_13090 [Promethearchaeota archaeon]